MMAKYGVVDDDLYNFNETGFMMGVITASMVITRSDRHRKAKSVQPGNRESNIKSRGNAAIYFDRSQDRKHPDGSYYFESGYSRPKKWMARPIL
jgi:hypothetical protein